MEFFCRLHVVRLFVVILIFCYGNCILYAQLLAKLPDGSILFQFGLLSQSEQLSQIPQQTEICEIGGKPMKNSGQETAVTSEVYKLEGNKQIQDKDFVMENNISIERGQCLDGSSSKRMKMADDSIRDISAELDGFSSDRMKMSEGLGRDVGVGLDNSGFDSGKNARVEAGKCEEFFESNVELKEDCASAFGMEEKSTEKNRPTGDCDSSSDVQLKPKGNDMFCSKAETTLLAHIVPETAETNGDQLVKVVSEDIISKSGFNQFGVQKLELAESLCAPTSNGEFKRSSDVLKHFPLFS